MSNALFISDSLSLAGAYPVYDTTTLHDLMSFEKAFQQAFDENIIKLFQEHLEEGVYKIPVADDESGLDFICQVERFATLLGVEDHTELLLEQETEGAEHYVNLNPSLRSTAALMHVQLEQAIHTYTSNNNFATVLAQFCDDVRAVHDLYSKEPDLAHTMVVNDFNVSDPIDHATVYDLADEMNALIEILDIQGMYYAVDLYLDPAMDEELETLPLTTQLVCIFFHDEDELMEVLENAEGHSGQDIYEYLILQENPSTHADAVSLVQETLLNVAVQKEAEEI